MMEADARLGNIARRQDAVRDRYFRCARVRAGTVLLGMFVKKSCDVRRATGKTGPARSFRTSGGILCQVG
jgi:hypothetical protein